MASALYSLLGFFKNEPPFQPFVDQHIIYPYFVPISPHWAEVETSIFQLVGLDPDTTYRIFPPEYFYPPRLPRTAQGPRATPVLLRPRDRHSRTSIPRLVSTSQLSIRGQTTTASA
ncbi:hypothetical protein PG996_003261 [Apiospora saccharicola]|uniref:Uncharacterized protein n=1 Tax=Apiospora saccharicola TaxID=335842 RepID=A0ABR1W3D4_9PEZI